MTNRRRSGLDPDTRGTLIAVFVVLLCYAGFAAVVALAAWTL